MSASEIDVSHLEGAVCAGAWRFLCACMLLQTAQRLQAEAKHGRVVYESTGGGMKESAFQQRAAKNWLDGGIGVITFEDCCEALDVDCDAARNAIARHCEHPEKTLKRPIRFRNTCPM